MRLNLKTLAAAVIFITLFNAQYVFAADKEIFFEAESKLPPFSYMEDGVLSGFQIDLSKMLFASRDYTVNYKPSMWENAYNDVKTGSADCCGLVVINDSRKKDILFTKPIIQLHVSIYVKKDAPQVTLGTLNHYSGAIGVVKDNFTESILKDKLSMEDYTTFSDAETALNALKSGNIKVLFECQEVINYIIIKDNLRNAVVSSASNLFPVDASFGISKNNPELVQFINNRMDTLIKSGIYEELYENNFFTHSINYTKTQTKIMFIYIFFIAAGLLIAALFIRSYINFLKKQLIIAHFELYTQHQWLKATLSSIVDAVIATDNNGLINFLNIGAEHLTGFNKDESIGKHINEVLLLIDENSGQPITFNVDSTNVGSFRDSVSKGNILISKKGEKFFVTFSSSPIKDDENNINGNILIIKDITEIREAELKLAESYDNLEANAQLIEKIAYTDSLTDLPNRLSLLEYIKGKIDEAACTELKFAVLFFDLDNFKSINDTRGHYFGDELLKSVAARLKNSIRSEDFLARLGGDEFMLVANYVVDTKYIYAVVDKILSAFELPFMIQNHEVAMTTSIGIAVYPYDGLNEMDIIKNADTAMYKAKESGKNKYVIFNSDMNRKITEKVELENYLRHAISKKELMVYYQPQIDIKSNEIVSMEALLRWKHPLLGMVSPDTFISLAEECGLIKSIGEWVLRNACVQNKLFQDAGYRPLKVAVNLSAKQFQDANLYETVMNILYDTGLEPKYLELEITESAALQYFESTIVTLEKFMNAGINISLDDFGKGYSSLNYLNTLPIRSIKIDKSFVQNVALDGYEHNLTKSIISIAHDLKLNVVAEGVETELQYTVLKRMDCNIVQGYLFSRPIPACEFEKLLI